MDSIRLELRLALRSLFARPLFSGVAILSIALGVGFTTAIFSGVNSLLLRPVPGVDAPDRVVEVGRTRPDGSGFDSFTYPDFLDVRENASTLDEVAAWRQTQVSWTSDEGGVTVSAILVSSGYFRVLGIVPDRGRLFGPGEDERGGPAVAVVSHRFWRDRLGSAEDVVGRTIELNRTPVTVIGVAPAAFTGHFPALAGDVYMPIARMEVADPTFNVADYTNRRASWLLLIGRLAPGASVETADAEVGTIMSRLADAYPESNSQTNARVIELGPVPGGGRGAVTGFLAVLMVLVAMVLLVAAANVAGMLLARAASREREIAIRLALGSGRGRLVRQLVMEALTLFIVGGATGLALAAWGTNFFSGSFAIGPETVTLDIRADARVAAFSLGVSLVTGLVFGLIPALKATRPDLVPALKDEGRTSVRGGRARAAFVSAQVALSLILLVAAGLFLRSLQQAGAVDAGFDPAGVLVVPIDLALDGYDEASGLRLHDGMLARLRSLPGVRSAAVAQDLPMDLSTHGTPIWPEGHDDADGRGIGNEVNTVTPGYFKAARIPVLQGRDFGEGDNAGAELVVVINRALAAAAWPGDDPLGKRLRFGASEAPLRTVVGVVADVKNAMLAEDVAPMTYLPYAQRYRSSGYAVVGGTGLSATAIRRALLDVDPRLTLGPVQRLEDISGVGLLPQRIAATLGTVLGALALFLSALGIYGVVAFSVAQRKREIGVRLAVGASTRQVSAWVLRRGLRLALPGLVIGMAAAIGLSRLLVGLLFGVSPGDPTTFLTVPALLIGVAITASAGPALRAARVDPMEALQSE